MKKTSLILTVFAAVLIAALIITSLALGKNTAEPVSGDEISSPESSNVSEDAEQSGVPSEESPDESPAPSEDEPSSDVTGEEESSAVSASESSEPVEESSEPKEESSEPVEESSEPKEESSEPVTIPPDGKDRVVHFLACPDNIIHPSVYYDALERAAKNAGKKPDYSSLGTAEYDFSPIYENVAAHIAAADLSYINVETLIGGNQNKISGYPTFNSPEAAGEYLVTLGFDIMNVAHNHMLDSKDDKYLKNCYNFFTQRGKTVIGYYKNDAAVDNIVVIEKNGIKIALLAYTDSTNGIKLSSSSSTVIPYFSEKLLKRQIPLAKKLADIVIVSAHWGSEDSYTANSTQRTYAQQMIDLGVDVIIGMHPHCLQEMGWRTNKDGHKTLLVYSLGNFISGMLNADNMLGGMLDFDIVKDGKT
ncbi:MAG: CapA family protein, partial [Clostridia bacterium]|nr:CapA family protein [Clostridia bacterium]